MYVVNALLSGNALNGPAAQ